MESKGRILIIDDEEGIRRGCRRVLEPAGFSVETATGFQDGLHKIQEGEYELVLLDVMMPDGRGLDLLDPIRARDPETVPLIITGYATVELAVDTVKRGAYDFISKPFTGDVLLAAVNRGLEKRHLSLDAKRLQAVEQEAAEAARAREQAERLNEFKSSFATMVAHELRSPVGGVQSLVRTMLRGMAGKLTEQQMELLTRIEDRLNFLLSLINDLLVLAASKSLETERPLQAVNVQAVLQRVVERFSVEAHGKHVTLKQSVPSKPLIIGAHEDGLDAILRNLIGNAIKYTSPPGSVQVDVAREGDYARIQVVDTGIGISAEDLPHIGEEFFRARNAHQAGLPGTGLGMSIVKQFVDRFGGKISVESRENKGTTFTILLPLWKE